MAIGDDHLADLGRLDRLQQIVRDRELPIGALFDIGFGEADS
jgi:hypothetical protein